MAYIQGKVKGKKIVSFKFKTCLGRDDNGKQIFKCWTWYPPADLTPAKARKEADRVADRWEAEQRLAFSQQKAEEETAPPAPVYTFDTFVNEVWIPLCARWLPSPRYCGDVHQHFESHPPAVPKGSP